MILDNLKQVLQEFGAKVVYEAKFNAQKNALSGKLLNSIGFRKKVDMRQSIVTFFMEKYGQYQDLGVKGTKKGESVGKKYYGNNFREFKYTTKMPPPSSFDQWVIRRGGKFNKVIRDSKGRFVKRSVDSVGFKKSLTFLIARSIFGKGIKPTLFFTKPFNKYYTNLPEQVANAYGQDFDTSVQLIFDKK
jgi:hypothetical protein